MTTVRTVLIALLLPHLTEAQDSTATQPTKDHTPFDRIGLEGAHIASGGGSGPCVARSDRPGETGQVRIGVTPRSFPEWTIAWASRGGGEQNIAGWFRVSVIGGYRMAGAKRIASGTGTNSGASSAVLFEFGRF